MNNQQLTLGQLIEKIEQCGLQNTISGKPKEVVYDFGTAIPTNLTSYRGYYEQLALGYRLTGYDADDSNHFAKITANDLLNELKSGVGKIFIGWKGGEYQMHENTPVWIANAGNSSGTAIVNVVD